MKIPVIFLNDLAYLIFACLFFFLHFFDDVISI